VATKTKKPRQWGRVFFSPQGKLLSGDDAYEFAIPGPFYLKYHLTIGGGEEGVVMATTDIFPGVKTGATLTHDDVTGDNLLAAENLHAKAFRF
jgi:hypothetical protein